MNSWRYSSTHSPHSQIQIIRATIRSLIAQYEASCEPAPLDRDLYQECIDEAIRRGYPVDGDHSVRTFLRVGAGYGAIAGGHLDRPTQIWLALYTSSVTYIDETSTHFPSEIPNIYLFNDRFIGGRRQGNAVLDALADLIRRAPDLFQAIPSKLIMTSSLNFVTANLLEYETASMQVCMVVVLIKKV